MPDPIWRRPWFLLVGLTATAAIAAVAWFLAARKPATLLDQARQAYDQSDYRAAAAHARAWLRERPLDRDGQRVLARAQFRLGNDESAQALYERVGMDHFEAEDFARLAEYLNRIGQVTPAFQLLQRGEALDPNHAETLSELVRFYTVMGRLNQAETLAARLANLPATQERGNRVLGMLRLELDRPAEAAPLLENAVAAEEGRDNAHLAAETRKLLARAYLSTDRARDAERALSPMLKDTNCDDPEVAWLLSRIRLVQADVPGAIAALTCGSKFAANDHMIREPAPYVGTPRCKACHEEIYETQQASRHATTFTTGDGLAAVDYPDEPMPDPGDNRVKHRWSAEPGQGASIETTRDADSVLAHIRHAFGSGDRGSTFVGQDDAGQWLELRISHYGRDSVWDVTTGHNKSISGEDLKALHEFSGRILDADQVRRCLECHTTSPKMAQDPTGPLHADRGIGCERCHGPAGHHLLAVEAQPAFPDLAIAQPRLATSEEVTALCARCHSPIGMEVSRDDPTAIRFQGATLTWSKCYSESNGKLSCVTCHDPHRNAETSHDYYEAKCLQCHSATETPASAEPAKPAPDKPCPINPRADCVSCHMPTRVNVLTHTAFTDHWIRVHPEGSGTPK